VQHINEASAPIYSDDNSGKRENTKSGNTESAVQGTRKFLSPNKYGTTVK
jgi:hypothetical protein